MIQDDLTLSHETLTVKLWRRISEAIYMLTIQKPVEFYLNNLCTHGAHVICQHLKANLYCTPHLHTDNRQSFFCPYYAFITLVRGFGPNEAVLQEIVGGSAKQV